MKSFVAGLARAIKGEAKLTRQSAPIRHCRLRASNVDDSGRLRTRRTEAANNRATGPGSTSSILQFMPSAGRGRLGRYLLVQILKR